MKYVTPGEFAALARKGATAGIGVRKFLAAQTEALPDRCIKFVISTDAVDRQADKIDQDGWDLAAYSKNPVVLWGHNDAEPPVAKCVSIGIEDGKLKATVQFLPAETPVYGARAEGIYQMLCGGFLSATSVGFRPLEFQLTKDAARGASDFDPGADFTRCELVEFSIVSVPCNPEALIEATPQVAEPTVEPAGEQVESRSLNSSNSRDRRRRQLALLDLVRGMPPQS